MHPEIQVIRFVGRHVVPLAQREDPDSDTAGVRPIDTSDELRPYTKVFPAEILFKIGEHCIDPYMVTMDCYHGNGIRLGGLPYTHNLTYISDSLDRGIAKGLRDRFLGVIAITESDGNSFDNFITQGPLDWSWLFDRVTTLRLSLYGGTATPLAVSFDISEHFPQLQYLDVTAALRNHWVTEAPRARHVLQQELNTMATSWAELRDRFGGGNDHRVTFTYHTVRANILVRYDLAIDFAMDVPIVAIVLQPTPAARVQ